MESVYEVMNDSLDESNRYDTQIVLRMISISKLSSGLEFRQGNLELRQFHVVDM